MTRCDNCNEESNRLKFLDRWCCHNCLNISEAGGSKTRALQSRNRNRHQSYMHEKDFLIPHRYDKNEKKYKLNEDFAKAYPDKVGDYFEKEELQRDYPKLAKKVKNRTRKKEV